MKQSSDHAAERRFTGKGWDADNNFSLGPIEAWITTSTSATATGPLCR